MTHFDYNNLVFSIPGLKQQVMLQHSAFAHIKTSVQNQKSNREVGGQLFGTIRGEHIFICRATGPYSSDVQNRFSFMPSRTRERRDIHRYFKIGLHFFGDWHSHPQEYPKPSSIDLDNIKECFRQSSHDHSSFLLLIVGTDCDPSKLWLSQHNSDSYRRLTLSA